MISFKDYRKQIDEGRAALKTPHQKTVDRLKELNSNLNKYAHRWSENPSRRLQDWVDEYNDTKRENRPAWEEHCKKHGLTTSHDAYDCLA